MKILLKKITVLERESPLHNKIVDILIEDGTIIDISEPMFSFFNIFSKFFLEASSIDRGETANGRGFRFPLVISTLINAFESENEFK